jgi:methylmalonyl-CoA/ethylmalonyl-CoA epimerase
MKIKRIAHIGIAVKDADEAARFFTDKLDMTLDSQESLGELKISFLPVGDANLEFVQSTTEDGVIAKHIGKKGEGVQHIAFEVDDVEAALAELKAKGVRLLDETPRPGAHGAKIAFIHPKETNGVLTEICEYPDKH